MKTTPSQDSNFLLYMYVCEKQYKVGPQWIKSYGHIWSFEDATIWRRLSNVIRTVSILL